MQHSSPAHARAASVIRSRTRAALIIASVCALIGAILVPLTSHVRAQAASQVPVTIPSLDGWAPASGAWTPSGSIQILRTDSEDARGVSALLMRALTDFGLDVTEAVDAASAAGSAPAAGAIALTIDPARTSLGDEGYQLTVTATGAQITAATRAGLLWGARSLEQGLRGGSGTIPAGSITDIPRYPDRGVTLCACGTHITPDWIIRQIDRMSDLKMNYLSLELRLTSDKYPATTSFPYYTKEEVRAIVEHGRDVGVRVVPLLNAPGHTGAFLGNFPQFQVTKDNGTKSPNHLNYVDPAAQQFYFDLIDEYMDAFDATEWHMGADEFFFRDAPKDFTNYLAQIRAAYGDQTMTFDAAFNDFVNKVNAHVKSRGATLRLWNDGIVDLSRIPIDKDVIIEYWGRGESSLDGVPDAMHAKELVEAGYTLVNASSELYYYRAQPSSYVIQHKGGADMYPRWTMNTFYTKAKGEQKQDDYRVPDASIRGGKISLWPGSRGKVTDHETEAWISDGLRYGAQMFWNAKTPAADATWAAFQQRIAAVGEPSTYVDPTRGTLDPGTYSITLASDGRGMRVSEGTPTLGEVSDTWELIPTPDGYYQIRSVDTNRCLAVYAGEIPESTDEAPTAPGHPISTDTCADVSFPFSTLDQGDYAARNPQKWVAERAGDGFRLRNGLTNQYLSVIDSGYLSRRPNGGKKSAVGTIAQLPLDVTLDSSSVFTLAAHDPSALSVTVAREGDEAYPKDALEGMDRASLPIIGDENWGETVLKVSVTNTSDQDVTGIRVTPAVTNSWKLANGPQPIDRLAPGETRVVKFWARPTTEFGHASFIATVSHSGHSAVASHGLVGVCGPRIKAEAIAADSTDTANEASDVKKATDSDPTTSWISQYTDKDNKNKKLSKDDPVRSWPHWVDIQVGDGTTSYDLCALTYTPRQGTGPKASGRARSVQIYVADTAAGLAGQGDNRNDVKQKGNPLVEATLINRPHTLDIPLDARAAFLRFRGSEAQKDVAGGLTDIMSVGEVGVRIGRSH